MQPGHILRTGWGLGLWFVGITLALGCESHSDVPRFDEVEVELPDGTELEFPAALVSFKNDRGEPLDGVLIYPDADGPLPAVIVLHGAGGLFSTPDSDDDKLEVSRQFAEWAALLTRSGHAVLLPSSFYSRGYFEWRDRPSDIDGTERLIMRVFDAYAALRFACDQPRIDCSRVALMGFSNGASVTALSLHERLDEVEGLERLTPASRRPAFALGFSWYPGCGFEALVAMNMKDPDEFYYPAAPLQIFHGARDSLLKNCEMRLEQTDELTSLRGGSVNPFALRAYDRADHGFDSSPGSSAEREARDDARARTLTALSQGL